MTKRSIRRPKSVTDAVAEAFISRHLPYEVQMMRELHPELTSGRYNQLIHNSNIQSFCIHARNLIEFFKNKKSCDFDPRLFTDSRHEPNGDFIEHVLEGKIHQQIAHLTAQRTANAEDQLGPKQWTKILKRVNDEIERFEAALTPEFRKKWEKGLQDMVFTGTGTGASSSPSSSSLLVSTTHTAAVTDFVVIGLKK